MSSRLHDDVHLYGVFVGRFDSFLVMLAIFEFAVLSRFGVFVGYCFKRIFVAELQEKACFLG